MFVKASNCLFLDDKMSTSRYFIMLVMKIGERNLMVDDMIPQVYGSIE